MCGDKLIMKKHNTNIGAELLSARTNWQKLSGAATQRRGKEPQNGIGLERKD